MMSAGIAMGCKRKVHLPRQYWDYQGISVSSYFKVHFLQSIGIQDSLAVFCAPSVFTGVTERPSKKPQFFFHLDFLMIQKTLRIKKKKNTSGVNMKGRVYSAYI